MPPEWALPLATLALTGLGTGAGLLLRAWLAERRRLEDQMIAERSRMEAVWVADRAEANAVMRAMLDQCHNTLILQAAEQRAALDDLRLALSDHTAEDRRAADQRRSAYEAMTHTLEELSAELLMRRRGPDARTRREDTHG